MSRVPPGIHSVSGNDLTNASQKWACFQRGGRPLPPPGQMNLLGHHRNSVARELVANFSQWDRIKDLLPARPGSVGSLRRTTSRSSRQQSIRIERESPGVTCAERCDPKKLHQRFSRWPKAGVWQRVFQHLAVDADKRIRHIRQHYCARRSAPLLKIGEDSAIGRSPGGPTPTVTQMWHR